jgi:hypothetical protein
MWSSILRSTAPFKLTYLLGSWYLKCFIPFERGIYICLIFEDNSSYSYSSNNFDLLVNKTRLSGWTILSQKIWNSLLRLWLSKKRGLNVHFCFLYQTIHNLYDGSLFGEKYLLVDINFCIFDLRISDLHLEYYRIK